MVIIGDISVSGFCVTEVLRHTLVIFVEKHMIGGKNYHKLKIKYYTKYVQMDLKRRKK